MSEINDRSLIAERAKLVLPALIKYMEKKDAEFTKMAKQHIDGGAGKMLVANYDNLIMTRAAANAILNGEAERSIMVILGLIEKHPNTSFLNNDKKEMK